MDTVPQIDYGTLYLPIGENRRPKKVHVLLVTLSHSRKATLPKILVQLGFNKSTAAEILIRFYSDKSPA